MDLITILEVLDRAEKGLRCAEKDFDLKILAPKVKELVKEHDIKFNPENIVPTDESLADDIFEAGMELALNVGILCRDTERIIKFEERELREAIRYAPSRVTLGAGQDSALLSFRGIESKIPPIVIGGGTGTPISEEIFTKQVMSYVKEPVIDVYGAGVPATIGGRILKTGSPFVPYAAKREIYMIREVFRRAGRPGMCMMAPGITTTALGAIVASSTDSGRRKTDVCGGAILSELKIDYDRLTKVVHAVEWGGVIRNLYDPMIGGFAGGPAGVAVVSIAGILLGLPTCQATFTTIHPVHLRYLCTSCPEGMWVESVVGQAISRNTHLLATGNVFVASGPCTEMILHVVAANAISAAVSGLQLGPGVGAANTRYQDHASGLETKFMGEIGHALAKSGLKRADANEIVRDLSNRYKERLLDPPLGKRFQECYDLHTVKPTEEWLQIYDSVKKELSDYGLRFDLLK